MVWKYKYLGGGYGQVQYMKCNVKEDKDEHVDYKKFRKVIVFDFTKSDVLA